jgi:phosphate:Na+ symporter
LVYFNIVLQVLGGLALFIFGIDRLSSSLQKLTSNKLKSIINFLAKKPWSAAIIGIVGTVMIQSSSALSVMTVGFVNAGLVTLRQAIGIIMGANIGTTLTAQIVSFNLDIAAFPIVIIGCLFYFISRKKRLKNIGMMLIGLGLVLFGMLVMKNSLAPLKENESFRNTLIYFSKNPIMGILVGAVMTGILQSSAGTIGMLIALAAQGLLPFASAIPILMGDNIGTCTTALFASIGTTVTAKRTALSHLMFNIFGTIIFSILLYGFKLEPFIERITGSSVPHQIANMHTIFNVTTTIILLPMIGLFEKFIIKIFPGKDVVINKNAIHLEPRLIKTPIIALEQVSRELTRLLNISREMFELTHKRLHKQDTNLEKQILDREAAVDSVTEDTVRYLTKISQAYLTNALSNKLTNLLHASYDIERTSDHTESIMYLIIVKEENKMIFSDEANLELQNAYSKVGELFDSLLEGIEKNDPVKLLKCEELESGLDAIVKEIRTNHLIRIRNNKCMPLSGVTFTDIILHLERMGDLLYGVSMIYRSLEA